MANQYIQTAPDSTGKKLQTFENTVGGQTVQSQAVTPTDQNGNPITNQQVTPADASGNTLARTDNGVPQVATGITGLLVSIQRLLQGLVRPMWVDPATMRTRVSIEAGGVNINAAQTLATVTTVTSLTSLNQLAGHDVKATMLSTLDRTCYYQGPRQRIT
jgi:hypothetical protein